jgi:hypothetical protein
MATSLEQLVRNQILLREVNERVAEVVSSWNDPSPEFLCECSTNDCTERVSLSLVEYARVRSSPNLFVIHPGHECLDVDQVVERGDGFTLVVKTKHVDLALSSHHPPEGGQSSNGKIPVG